LVIQGARQVGKTWVMRHFGEQHFKKIALGIAAFSPIFCWLYD
jgi:predicted AAA+ superfamily ATPase